MDWRNEMHRITAKTLRACQKAADRDHADALWELGSYHHYGAKTRSGKVLVRRNLAQAKRYFQRAADLGKSSAQVSLAELSAENGDTAEEMRHLRRALALGEASAAYNLGICYRDLGQPKRAHAYYQRALAMGDPGAHLQLGLCAMLGVGTAQNFQIAHKHFQSISKAPNDAMLTPRDREDALHWLALLNLLGLAGRRQVAKARTMLLKADADRDHEPAGELLNVLGRTAAKRRN